MQLSKESKGQNGTQWLPCLPSLLVGTNVLAGMNEIEGMNLGPSVDAKNLWRLTFCIDSHP